MTPDRALPPAPDPEAQPASLRPLLVASLALVAGALLLAWRERPHVASYRGDAFRLLFARDEPAGAALLLATLLVAPFLAWLLGPALALPQWLARHRRTVAVTATVLLAAGAVVVYRARPLAMDEYAPWFQARVFAAGHLTARLPPDLLPRLIPARLLYPFFATSPGGGAVVSTYWPGFALLLTPFTWVRAPWLLDPLLGGLCLLLLATLAHRWTGDPAAAGWALLLTLASPAFVINAISFYPLTAHLALNLSWMALLVEGGAGGAEGADAVPPQLTARPARLLAAGLVGSLALVLANPVPHAVFAAPWIVALLGRRGPRPIAWLALGYLPLSLLLGAGWTPLRFGLAATVSASSTAAGAPGLARAAHLFAGAFALPGPRLLAARLLALAELVTWAAPFLPVLALLGWRATRRGSPLRLLAASAAATLLIYCFVPFDQGHGWGYRYFHPAWSALPLLAAAGLVTPRAARWRAPVLAAALLALPLADGLRATQVRSFIGEHRAQLPAVPEAGRHLVFVALAGGSYRVDLLQNDPFLRERVITMASVDPASDAALVRQHFPAALLLRRSATGSVWALP